MQRLRGGYGYLPYHAPDKMEKANGSARYAFVSFLMLNDSYLPGALVVGYALRKQGTRADRVCLVTENISRDARYALERVFDHVVDVDQIFVPHKRRQARQDRPYMFTRMNALRLGADGDLGLAYEKVIVLDADVLPFKYYDHLFTLDVAVDLLEDVQKVVGGGRPKSVRIRFGDKTIAELPVALTAAAALTAGLAAVLLSKLAIDIVNEEDEG